MPTYYHGSPKRFSQFRLNQWKRGKAIFLTDDFDDAQSYGRFVYTVKLDPGTNIFDFRSSSHINRLTTWVEAYLAKQPPYRGDNFYPFTQPQVLTGIKNGKWHYLSHPIITKALKALRFDGWYEIESGREQVGVSNTKKLEILDVTDTQAVAARVVARFIGRDGGI